jgi:hypothetical protein
VQRNLKIIKAQVRALMRRFTMEHVGTLKGQERGVGRVPWRAGMWKKQIKSLKTGNSQIFSLEMYDEIVEKRHSADLIGLADWKLLKRKKKRCGCMKRKTSRTLNG